MAVVVAISSRCRAEFTSIHPHSNPLKINSIDVILSKNLFFLSSLPHGFRSCCGLLFHTRYKVRRPPRALAIFTTITVAVGRHLYVAVVRSYIDYTSTNAYFVRTRTSRDRLLHKCPESALILLYIGMLAPAVLSRLTDQPTDRPTDRSYRLRRGVCPDRIHTGYCCFIALWDRLEPPVVR